MVENKFPVSKIVLLICLCSAYILFRFFGEREKPPKEVGEPPRAAYILRWLMDSPDDSAVDKIASKLAN